MEGPFQPEGARDLAWRSKPVVIQASHLLPIMSLVHQLDHSLLQDRVTRTLPQRIVPLNESEPSTGVRETSEPILVAELAIKRKP
jgi:hypothetical protein